MTDRAVEEGATARLGHITGDLRVGRKATVLAESGGKVTVSGTARFEGPVTIACDLECGMLRVTGRGFGPGPAHGDVEVRGSLTVHGGMEIDAAAEVSGEISAERVDIGGHLESKSVTSKMVRVGGHMKTRGALKAEDVDVGGHMTVDDQIDVASLRVGGHADIGGGSVRGEVRVRGHLKTRGRLSYGDLKVFGHMTLPGGSSGGRLDALGKVEFEGDASCEVLEVNGVVSGRGNLGADSVKVNGRLDVEGSLKVGGKLEVFGSAESKKEVECDALVAAGRASANRVVVVGRAEVGGQVWTSGGLRAKEVVVGSGSRVDGPIIAETVEVGAGTTSSAWAALSSLSNLGRMTRVDDVYGKDVRIDRYSRAGRVFGETVRMQGGSMADEVTYTKEADISEGVHLEKPPRKVDRLPDAQV